MSIQTRSSCLAQREMEKRRSPLVHRFRPLGRDFLRHWGSMSDDSWLSRCQPRESHERSGHVKTGPIFPFLPVARFQRKNLAPGSLSERRLQLGGPGASPGLSLLEMTTEEMSSRGPSSAR